MLMNLEYVRRIEKMKSLEPKKYSKKIENLKNECGRVSAVDAKFLFRRWRFTKPDDEVLKGR